MCQPVRDFAHIKNWFLLVSQSLRHVLMGAPFIVNQTI